MFDCAFYRSFHQQTPQFFFILLLYMYNNWHVFHFQCLLYLYHYPDIWYDFAMWHAKNGSIDSAAKVFQRAIKALPGASQFTLFFVLHMVLLIDSESPMFTINIFYIDRFWISEIRLRRARRISVCDSGFARFVICLFILFIILFLSDDFFLQMAKTIYEGLLSCGTSATSLAHIQVGIFIFSCMAIFYISWILFFALMFLILMQYIRFLRRTEGVESARKYFLDARKLPDCTYHVYVAYALMTFSLDKDSKVILFILFLMFYPFILLMRNL